MRKKSSVQQTGVLVAAFFLVNAMAPVLSEAPADIFYRQCVIGCVGEMNAGQCEASCSCVRNSLEEQLDNQAFANLNEVMRTDNLSEEQEEMMEDIGRDCANASSRAN